MVPSHPLSFLAFSCLTGISISLAKSWSLLKTDSPEMGKTETCGPRKILRIPEVRGSDSAWGLWRCPAEPDDRTPRLESEKGSDLFL